MIAGCVAACGAWTGELIDKPSLAPKGVYVNKALDAWLKDHYGNSCRIIEEPHVFPDEIVETFPQPWMFKCGIQYWRVFEPYLPRWILVRRSLDAILASAEKVGWETALGFNCAGTPEDVLEERHEEMDYVRDYEDGMDVDAARVASGDFEELHTVISLCGLEWNEKAVRDFVEPTWWHHR